MESNSIRQTAADLRDGKTTSREIVERALQASDRLDPLLGTYLCRFDETALQAAEHADNELGSGTDRGPLHGIPLGIKDIISTNEVQPQLNPLCKTHLGEIRAMVHCSDVFATRAP